MATQWRLHGHIAEARMANRGPHRRGLLLVLLLVLWDTLGTHPGNPMFGIPLVFSSPVATLRDPLGNHSQKSDFGDFVVSSMACC